MGAPCIALAYDIRHAGFFDIIGLPRFCFDAAIEALSKQVELRKIIFSRRERYQEHVDQFVRDSVVLLIQST